MLNDKNSRNKNAAPTIAKLSDKFIDALNESVELLHGYQLPEVTVKNTTIEPLPSLLDECRALLQQADAKAPTPIRTVHHLACTGGTLIVKCLAAMPNVQVLSEVNPLSPQALATTPAFFPTDLARLSHASSRGADQQLLLDIFLAGLEVLYRNSFDNGLRLIVRDHAHSQFCFGPLEPTRPTLRQVIEQQYSVRSIVTVRHPLDSYLSLMNNGWCHFEPGNLDEYAVRYLAFLDRHKSCVTFKYEDFTESPDTVLSEMCASLDMAFNPAYADLFPAFKLSGDSGRSGNTISPRQHREVPDLLRTQAESSESWQALCHQLNYPPIF